MKTPRTGGGAVDDDAAASAPGAPGKRTRTQDLPADGGAGAYPDAFGLADADADAGGDAAGADEPFRMHLIGPGAGFAPGAAAASAPAMPTGLGMRKPAGGAKAGLDLRLPEQDPLSPRMERFRAALIRRDRAAAETEWLLAGTDERAAFAASPSIELELGWVLDTMGIGLMMVMGQTGLDFGPRPALAARVLGVMMPLWLDSMAVHGLVDSFVVTLPPRWEIDARTQPIFDRLMKGSNSLEAGRALFERMYTKLADTSYDPTTIHTHPWTRPWIDRLYQVVSTHLPLSHVRAVEAFHIGYEFKEKASDAAFKPLEYGWWSGSHVVLNESSAKTGGTNDHDMTGGGNAHTDAAAGKKPGQGALSHFDGTALHEVGHAVGARMGGNAWTDGLAFAAWKTNLDAETWSKELWGDDATLTARARIKIGTADLPSAAEVRRHLAHTFDGNGTLIPGWDDIRLNGLIDLCYDDQPLTRYWKKAKGDRDHSYNFSGTNNYGKDGKHVYVWLSRSGSGFSRYSQDAHAQKVSWYSLASPHEWFAEQYAHYHRLTPRGAGMEGETKRKLDELNAEEFPDPNAPPAAGTPTPAADDGTVDTTPAPKPAAPPAGHRLPFPWF